MRRMVRRVVPFRVRLQIAVWRRRARDRRSGVRLAKRRPAGCELPARCARYKRSFIDYPGQEALALAKRTNQRVLASFLDGVVLLPGETLSVWDLAGEPTELLGYAEAAALKDGLLVSDIGGAICLLSTLILNTALLGGLSITERWCHSVDSYGDDRYFELGRDAAIEYGYRDLRFQNPYQFPVRLRIEIDDRTLHSWLEAPQALPDAAIDVRITGESAMTLDVETHRTRVQNGSPHVDVFHSLYRRA